ncbi:cysteine desulfurase family protein [Bdellovibrio svalbardensis]|uniref:cysteine desulfurase n=1 Tax=Bdellovibrio svalbardensis TaxID=2972972 RepID=A0ABT6DLT5_9BACT|nr:cysteine desulfurase family protein [Bdellovibrio svalbardensis]MDG0817841.1 cysteine desulfurase [Bdellovibrio svalbardensis]
MDTSLSAPMTTESPTSKDSGIYLDYNATTPVDPEVYARMEPYFKEYFGNPASAGHHWGWAADNAVQKARGQVASLIGAKANELIFTSGATEANNWVIFGLISKLRNENPYEPIHMITSCVEHSSTMKAMEAAQKLNVEVDFLPVNLYGQVDPEAVRKAIKPHTKLMSFIWVNNEIGTINPISEIAKIAKENQIYLHTDATQAVGKIPMNVTELGIDLMSFSGHKIYGPKGVGALFIRSKDPKVQINPLIYGGGQERGLRSGTLNVPAIVGLGFAAEICQRHLYTEAARLLSLRQLLWQKLQVAIPGIRMNGHPTERSPNNLSVTLPVKTDSLLSHLQKLGVSTGSACSSGAMTVSHVLRGIGLNSDQAQSTLRLSLGRWTTENEILRAADILQNAIPKKIV